MIYLYLNLPFRESYCIATDCTTLAQQLELKYGEFILSNTCDIIDSWIVAVKHGNQYIVSCEGKVQKVLSALQEIDRILFENAQYPHHIFALHGGAVEWNGRAHLFLASTMGGKTTLTSYLTGRGFGYITDDCILLDRNNLVVYPFPTPLHLRRGGMAVLEKYGALPHTVREIDDTEYHRYVYMPINAVKDPIPLESIFFISRSEKDNDVFEMSTGERTVSLLKSPIVNYEITGRYLHFVSQLAKVKCKRIEYTDMEYVMEVIRNECGN